MFGLSENLRALSVFRQFHTVITSAPPQPGFFLFSTEALIHLSLNSISAVCFRSFGRSPWLRVASSGTEPCPTNCDDDAEFVCALPQPAHTVFRHLASGLVGALGRVSVR